jgi:CubicO group peptidase (beta-lactamase class C family)
MHRFDLKAAAAQADVLAAKWDTKAGPGGAIILLDRDGAMHAACGGLADLASGVRVTPDTAFRWASLTKQVLAALTLHVGPALDETLDQHLASLSAPLGR